MESRSPLLKKLSDQETSVGFVSKSERFETGIPFIALRNSKSFFGFTVDENQQINIYAGGFHQNRRINNKNKFTWCGPTEVLTAPDSGP
jgi:hypothetical protein